MLLRSSSTPILGSIKSSLSNSAHHNSNHHQEAATNIRKHHPAGAGAAPFSHKKLSVHTSPDSPNRASHNASPVARFLEHNGFRRVQSEGNLMKRLEIADSCNEEFCSGPGKPRKLQARHTRSQGTRSFSFTNEDDESNSEMGTNDHFSINARGNVERPIPNNDSFEFRVTDDQMVVRNNVHEVETFGGGRGGLHLDMGGYQDLFLAIGLGLGGGYGVGSGDGYFDQAHGSGDSCGAEEHYRRMVENDPCNALLLRNYAQFLYESKNFARAEEYYARAILADPLDGELLAQYGSLLWQLYNDKTRASSYLERAVQASPHDSHVYAAYASFLWEVEEEEEEEEDEDERSVSLEFGLMAQQAAAYGVMASAWLVQSSRLTFQRCPAQKLTAMLAFVLKIGTHDKTIIRPVVHLLHSN